MKISNPYLQADEATPISSPWDKMYGRGAYTRGRKVLCLLYEEGVSRFMLRSGRLVFVTIGEIAREAERVGPQVQVMFLCRTEKFYAPVLESRKHATIKALKVSSPC